VRILYSRIEGFLEPALKLRKRISGEGFPPQPVTSVLAPQGADVHGQGFYPNSFQGQGKIEGTVTKKRLSASTRFRYGAGHFMSKKYTGLDDELYEYLKSVSLREDPICRRLREETAKMPMAGMQVAPDQAQFMALLVRLTGAREILEIGVFTGYSSLAMAMALPEGGHVTACDVSEEWTSIARRYWREAGVDSRIDLRIGPATDTLAELRENGRSGSYDLAFIDADKANYGIYYEESLKLVRVGGLIVVDNVLWSGRVADPKVSDVDTRAIRAFNAALLQDNRVEISMLPVGDGITLARRKK